MSTTIQVWEYEKLRRMFGQFEALEERVRGLQRRVRCLELSVCEPGNEQQRVLCGIVELVGKHFGFSLAQLRGKRRPGRLAWARQVAVVLGADSVGGSPAELGMFFGGRGHDLVDYARTAVMNRCATEAKARAEVESLRTAIVKMLTARK